MARHGWTCGISGKWHLGDSQIVQHGFTDWFVHQRGGGPYNDAPMVRNGQLTSEPGYLTDVITDEALRLMERYAGAGHPFYLGVHYTGSPQPVDRRASPGDRHSYDDCAFDSCPQEPRHPWAGALTRENMGNREALKGYFASVTAMDQSVGQLLDRLEQLGLRDRTLVVFLSDNASRADITALGKGQRDGAQEHVRELYQGSGHLQPPGRIPQGRVERRDGQRLRLHAHPA